MICRALARPVLSAPSAQGVGQSAQKAVDAAKDPLRRGLRMRHLHRQRPRLGNGLQKKPPRHPCADAHLPRFEHDVPLAPPALILVLRPIWFERNLPAAPVAHPQQRLGQKGPHRGLLRIRRFRVQDLPQPSQLLD